MNSLGTVPSAEWEIPTVVNSSDDPRRIGQSVWFWWLLAVSTAVYFVASIYLERSLFAQRIGRVQEINEVTDGFWVTMLTYTSEPDPPFWLTVRYWTVWPFFGIEGWSESSWYQAALIMLFALPLVLARINGRRYMAQQLLLFIPLFMSYRIAMCIYAVTYLYIYLVSRDRSTLLFILYSFLMVLSSSTLLFFLFYVPVLLWSRRVSRIQAFGVILPLFAILGSQFFSKISQLFFRMSAGEELGSGAIALPQIVEHRSSSLSYFVGQMVSGNPISLSLAIGQYDRLVVLSLLFVASLFILRDLMRRREYTQFLFFLIFIVCLSSEGIAAYASLGSVLLYIASRRDSLRDSALLRAC